MLRVQLCGGCNIVVCGVESCASACATALMQAPSSDAACGTDLKAFELVQLLLMDTRAFSYVLVFAYGNLPARIVSRMGGCRHLCRTQCNESPPMRAVTGGHVAASPRHNGRQPAAVMTLTSTLHPPGQRAMNLLLPRCTAICMLQHIQRQPLFCGVRDACARQSATCQQELQAQVHVV